MKLDERMQRAALRAVADACRMAKRLQFRLTRGDTLVKPDFSPVTIADYAVQALICQRLHTALGRFALVGEEGSEALKQPENARLLRSLETALQPDWPGVTADEIITAIDLGSSDVNSTGFWTLDPIDGTKGFLRGGQYAISLAYLAGNCVVFGVMGCPNLPADLSQAYDPAATPGQIFHATQGQGAWAISATEDPSRDPVRVQVRVRGAADQLRFCEPVESSHSNHAATEMLATTLAAAAPVRLDSQCKYAVVACGQADAYVRVPTDTEYLEKIWDHAAGVILASEAGAVVTDVAGRDLDFSCGSELQRNRGIVCATPDIHAQIVTTLRTL